MSEPSSSYDETQGSSPGSSRVSLSDEHKAAISAAKKGKPIKKRALWKLETRACANLACDNIFLPTYQPQRFCSRACARSVGNVVIDLSPKMCGRCGNEFTPRNGRQLFCSRTCARNQEGAELRQVAVENYDSDPVLCPCGKAIEYEGRHSRTYCSPECRTKYSTPGRVRDESNWVTRMCLNCGKEFEVLKAARRAGRYCSNSCARRHTKTTKHYAVERFDIVFDSTYEGFVWCALMIAKIPVERFDRQFGVEWSRGHWYGPDFWLPTMNVAIECKGVVDADDETKWTAFRESGNRLLVIGLDEIMDLSPASLKKMLV